MKLAKHFLLAAGLMVGLADAASAQLTATQDVTITVTAVNAITVSSGTVAISVGIGSTPNTSTTYNLTTNGTAVKITGGITAGTAFPTGVSLTVELAETTTGTSQGAKTINMGTAAADLVTGIAHVEDTNKLITYVATATAAASPTSSMGAKTVTFTVVP
jgi:hypothetical protein